MRELMINNELTCVFCCFRQRVLQQMAQLCYSMAYIKLLLLDSHIRFKIYQFSLLLRSILTIQVRKQVRYTFLWLLGIFSLLVVAAFPNMLIVYSSRN
jgi:hypothetical protein